MIDQQTVAAGRRRERDRARRGRPAWSIRSRPTRAAASSRTSRPASYKYIAMTDDRLSTEPVGVHDHRGRAGSASRRSRWRRRRRSWCRRSTSSAATRRPRSSCSATSPAADQRQGSADVPVLARARRAPAADRVRRQRSLHRGRVVDDGRPAVEPQVRPGTYDLIVTRGPEYEITQQTDRAAAPARSTAEQVALVRAYTSDGWVAGDFHIHAQPSTDSGAADRRPRRELRRRGPRGRDRDRSQLHHRLRAGDRVVGARSAGCSAIPGMELTTFEMGHFNGYPLRVDPGSTRGGEFRGPAAAAGAVRSAARARDRSGTQAIVQVNHPRQAVLGYFAQFFVDQAHRRSRTRRPASSGCSRRTATSSSPRTSASTSTRSSCSPASRLEDVHTFRAPDPLPPGPFPDPQPVPGQIVRRHGRPRRSSPASSRPGSRCSIAATARPGWAPRTATTCSATSRATRARCCTSAPARTCPAATSRDDVIDAIRQHHAIATQRAVRRDDDRRRTDRRHDRSRPAAASTSRSTSARRRGRRSITSCVYANSAIVADQAIPAAQGTDYETRVHLALARDSWVVAEATGQGNMFPVLSPTEFPPLDATVLIKALAVGLDLSALPLTSNAQARAASTSRRRTRSPTRSGSTSTATAGRRRKPPLGRTPRPPGHRRPTSGRSSTRCRRSRDDGTARVRVRAGRQWTAVAVATALATSAGWTTCLGAYVPAGAHGRGPGRALRGRGAGRLRRGHRRADRADHRAGGQPAEITRGRRAA